MICLIFKVFIWFDISLGGWVLSIGPFFGFVLSLLIKVKQSAREEQSDCECNEDDCNDDSCFGFVFFFSLVRYSPCKLLCYLRLDFDVGLFATDRVMHDKAEGCNAISASCSPRTNELIFVRELIYFSFIVLKNSDVIYS